MQLVHFFRHLLQNVFKKIINLFCLIFQEVAGANDDHKFGLAAAGSDIATENKVEGDAIVLFKKFDEGRNDMTERLTDVEAIGNFVVSNAIPLVEELEGKFLHYIFICKQTGEVFVYFIV